jgi:peptidoglycan/xylan/chitin deacetylase (PgdA/CDA1 family)
MREYGIMKTDAPYFLPPFEWYNQTISDWTKALNLQLINFTPGTRSHADYTTPDMKNYIESKAIMESIRKYEATDSAGLNGFIMLLHIGTGPKRADKFYSYLGELIELLRSKHYELIRVDELLHKLGSLRTAG